MQRGNPLQAVATPPEATQKNKPASSPHSASSNTVAALTLVMKEAADRACAIAQVLAILVVIAPALALDPAAEARIGDSILTLCMPPVTQLVQETSDMARALAHLTAFLLIVAPSLPLDTAGMVGAHCSGPGAGASCGGTISRDPPTQLFMQTSYDASLAPLAWVASTTVRCEEAKADAS